MIVRDYLFYHLDNMSFCARVSLLQSSGTFIKFFSQRIWHCADHRLPIEAAHVWMVKRGVKQVKLFRCKDDYKTQPVCSKYLFPDPANNVLGWCTMECCDSKTKEFCFEYSELYTNQYYKAVSQLFVSMTLSQLIFSICTRHNLCINLTPWFQLHRLLTEAARAQRIKWGVKRVSLFVCELTRRIKACSPRWLLFWSYYLFSHSQTWQWTFPAGKVIFVAIAILKKLLVLWTSMFLNTSSITSQETRDLVP